MRPHEIKSTIRAGVFISTLATIAAFITFFIGKENAFFEAKGTLFSKVKNAQGLKEGAPVLLQGIKIGRVKSLVMISLESISIELEVVESYLALIKTDSVLSIKTQGMLGDKIIEILGGTSTNASMVNKGTLVAEDATTVNEFINKGENILENANLVLSRLNQILIDVNDDRKLRTTFENLNKASAQLEKVASQVSAVNLPKIGTHIGEITRQIKEGPGSLHSLIYDTSLHDEIRALIGGAQRNKILKYFIKESVKSNGEDSKK